jgi:predicted MPP superfamily phosphohydrolase
MFTSTSLGRRLDAGLFRVGGVPLYITAGVGTSIVPARFLAPPEVVLLTLEPAEAVARR